MQSPESVINLMRLVYYPCHDLARSSVDSELSEEHSSFPCFSTFGVLQLGRVPAAGGHMRAKWKWDFVLAFSVAAGLLVTSTGPFAQTGPLDRGCCVFWQNANRLLARESLTLRLLTAPD